MSGIFSHRTGADDTLRAFKQRCEQSLYAFAKGILGRAYLTTGLHKPVCEWLQRCPPRRKLLLLPRACCKTTLVSHSLPLHILIQPKDANIYFPGQEGSDQRILLAGETETRACDHLRVVQQILEGNELFAAFWPHRRWRNPRRDAAEMER